MDPARTYVRHDGPDGMFAKAAVSSTRGRHGFLILVDIVVAIVIRSAGATSPANLMTAYGVTQQQ